MKPRYIDEKETLICWDENTFIPKDTSNYTYYEIVIPWLEKGNIIEPYKKSINPKWETIYTELEKCDLFTDLVNISIVYPEISTMLNLVILVITTTKSINTFQKRLDSLSQLMTLKNIELNPDHIIEFNSILNKNGFTQLFKYPYI